MNRFSRVLTAVLLAFCLGCGGGGGGGGAPIGPSPEPNPRPEDAPDVVLLTVSGHVGVLSAITCSSDENRPYLADPGEAAPALRARTPLFR